MAQCILDGGYSLGCKDNTGGIQEVYLGTFNTSDTYTIDSPGNSGVTSLSLTNTLYTFEQRNETAELIQEGQHSVENGTNFWVQTLNVTLHQMSADTRNTLIKLSQTDLICVIKDQNGSYWIVGKQNGSNIVGSTANLGKGYGDLNGCTCSIEGREPEPAHLLTESAFNTLTVV